MHPADTAQASRQMRTKTSVGSTRFKFVTGRDQPSPNRFASASASNLDAAYATTFRHPGRISSRHRTRGRGKLEFKRREVTPEPPAAGGPNAELAWKTQRVRARSTRLAGSVLECAIDLNFAQSASSSDNSIARRHAAMSFNPSSQSY
jgi:hypothetical protein